MANPVDVHVGNRLRLLRIEMGFSQEKVANAIGVTFQQVQKYEKGVNRLSASRLFAFSELLLVPISYFFDGLKKAGEKEQLIDLPMSPSKSISKISDRETLEVMRSYLRITDPKLRKSMSALIKSVANDQSVKSEV